MPCMKATGRKITTSEVVVAMTARPISFRPSMAACRGGFAQLLHVAEDIFKHHDGVIDDDAHGKRQAQQRHIVEREVHGAHEGEGRDQRGREWRWRR